MVNEEESSEYSDSDDEYGKKQWVPVKLPENFNPNIAPTDGMEYLYHVMYEAQNCETVVTVDLDTKKYAKNQTVYVESSNNCAIIPQCLLPTQQWQKEIVAEFTEFHNYILSRLATESSNDSCDYSYWIQQMDTEFPKFSDLSKFSASVQCRLLELITEKLSFIQRGSTVGHSLGCWIYSILSILQIPLFPDTHSILRNLTRQCIRIRSKLSADTPRDEFKNLNVFICIIARYFGQLDLADN